MVSVDFKYHVYLQEPLLLAYAWFGSLAILNFDRLLSGYYNDYKEFLYFDLCPFYSFRIDLPHSSGIIDIGSRASVVGGIGKAEGRPFLHFFDNFRSKGSEESINSHNCFTKYHFYQPLDQIFSPNRTLVLLRRIIEDVRSK